MSGKRRAGSSQITISLFAFQDIITCLSGIMILLLLIISVDIAAQNIDININELSAIDTAEPQVDSEAALKERIRNFKKVLNSSSDDFLDYQIRLQELNDKIQELEKNKKSLLEQTQIVSFIPMKNKNPNQRAILLECSGEFIRSEEITFPADSSGINKLIQYLEQFDKLRDYPVFIIKPSAANYAMQLVQKVQNIGFDAGYDAMAEVESVNFNNSSRSR